MWSFRKKTINNAKYEDNERLEIINTKKNIIKKK